MVLFAPSSWASSFSNNAQSPVVLASPAGILFAKSYKKTHNFASHFTTGEFPPGVNKNAQGIRVLLCSGLYNGTASIGGLIADSRSETRSLIFLLCTTTKKEKIPFRAVFSCGLTVQTVWLRRDVRRGEERRKKQRRGERRFSSSQGDTVLLSVRIPTMD